ncbi:UNVERIFIED_CONTAM: hypothetical protein NCL1_46799 [Trichonephila clavipes]
MRKFLMVQEREMDGPDRHSLPSLQKRWKTTPHNDYFCGSASLSAYKNFMWVAQHVPYPANVKHQKKKNNELAMIILEFLHIFSKVNFNIILLLVMKTIKVVVRKELWVPTAQNYGVPI